MEKSTNKDFSKPSRSKKFDLTVPGMPDKIPNMISAEEPPPKPLSDINSPNHIITTEPAVNVPDIATNSNVPNFGINPIANNEE